MRHIHDWKLIAKTYALPITELGVTSVTGGSDALIQGSTTLLWKCDDPNCQKLHKEVLIGKETQL